MDRARSCPEIRERETGILLRPTGEVRVSTGCRLLDGSAANDILHTVCWRSTRLNNGQTDRVVDGCKSGTIPSFCINFPAFF